MYPDRDPNENLTTVFFKRSSEFNAQLKCEFHPDLHGLYSWFAMFHTSIGKNLSAYNNWNFSSDTSSKWWDSVQHGFWFAETSTLLVYSVKYRIGYEQLENAYIRLQPERTYHINRNITKYFMGIPTKFANYTEDVVIWRKTVVVNDDNLTPVRKLGLGESFN